MLENIPFPPPSPMAPPEIGFAIAGSALLVGLMLVLWGRKLARAFLVLVGAGAGFLVAPLLSQRLHLPDNAVRFVAVFAIAILGLISARLVYALLAGLLGLVPAAVGICFRVGGLVQDRQPSAWEWKAQTLSDWAQSASGYFAAWGEGLIRSLPPMLFIFVGACVAVPLLAVLVWTRVGWIFMTSLIGAILMVAGAGMGAAQANAQWWASLLGMPVVLLSAAGGLMIVGWFVQGRALRRDAKAAAEKAAQGAGQEDKPASDEKKPKQGKSQRSPS